MAQHSGKDWSQVQTHEKHQWVHCLDKKIQGTRLNIVADVFPDDIMYNSQAPVTLAHNIFHTVRKNVESKYEEVKKQKTHARSDFETKFPRFKEVLINRTHFAREVIMSKYGIGPSSVMFDAIIKADRIWFKYHSGFYGYNICFLKKELFSKKVCCGEDDRRSK